MALCAAGPFDRAATGVSTRLAQEQGCGVAALIQCSGLLEVEHDTPLGALQAAQAPLPEGRQGHSRRQAAMEQT
jgi:hypothetical protein